MRKCNDLPRGSTAAYDQLMAQHDGSKCSDFIKGVIDWNLKSEWGSALPRVRAVAPAPPRRPPPSCRPVLVLHLEKIQIVVAGNSHPGWR